MSAILSFRRALPHGANDEPPHDQSLAGGEVAHLGRGGAQARWLALAAALARPAVGEVEIAGAPTSRLDDAQLAALRRERVSILSPRLLAYDPRRDLARDLRSVPGARGVPAAIARAVGVEPLLALKLRDWPQARIPLVPLLQEAARTTPLVVVFATDALARAAGGPDALHEALGLIADEGRAVLLPARAASAERTLVAIGHERAIAPGE